MSNKHISPKIAALASETERELFGRFCEIDEISVQNTLRVLEYFQELSVSPACFAGSTGYGYDDKGRDTLDKLYAGVFGAESALVRAAFANGTHAITSALFAATSPGTALLSVTGAPYDTVRTAIGIQGDCHGSMKYYGVSYRQLELLPDAAPDYAAIEREAARGDVSAVFIQRSRGYSSRRALSVGEIGKIAGTVKRVNPAVNVIVDNCYGEFTETAEPTSAGADLMAGSLIKNPGGGLATSGGYVAGRAQLVERAAYHLTSPGIGGECGANPYGYRLLYQGFFTAPHVTAQALKTAVFCAALFKKLGYPVSPGPLEPRSDIIQTIECSSPEQLKRFCRGIQAGAPVDSFASPEPWPMPGYDCDVIMASGSFVQGSSIELSADGPMKAPYTAYLQGGITYESGKIGIMKAAGAMTD